MTPQRLTDILAMWCDYMRDRSPDNGYPSTAAGIAFRACLDFVQMCDSSDQYIVLAADAVIDGLPLLERRAVSAVLLRARWDWPRIDPGEVYRGRARDMIHVGLVTRGIE